MNNNKISVGQPIWVRYKGFDHRRDKSAYEVIVTKVGRKYFEVSDENGRDKGKYEIETMLQAIDSNYRYKAYISLDEINIEDEFDKLNDEIKEAFRTYGKLPYTLQQLRDIKKIITNDNN